MLVDSARTRLVAYFPSAIPTQKLHCSCASTRPYFKANPSNVGDASQCCLLVIITDRGLKSVESYPSGCEPQWVQPIVCRFLYNFSLMLCPFWIASTVVHIAILETQMVPSTENRLLASRITPVETKKDFDGLPSHGVPGDISC